MQKNDYIKKYFEAANSIVISEMYLKEYLNSSEITEEDLKNYNPGHLGSSMSINFILSNLYFFLNEKKLNSKLIIGTGHSGVSLLANLWLNGTLEIYDERYSKNREGLNNLISDFGKNIRSEINPQYPKTIYDGGELGYCLGVAYGYALKSDKDIIPCIIGDGEAETGTLSSSWQLNKLLKTKSKILPIINLNGLKMGSKSYLSLLSNEELNEYFKILGYDVEIVDALNSYDLNKLIDSMQSKLNKSLNKENPLIIFKSLKGFTLKDSCGITFQGKRQVHKNPLQNFDKIEKLKIVKSFLSSYDNNIFDVNGNLLEMFSKFSIIDTDDYSCLVKKVNTDAEIKNQDIEKFEIYLNEVLNKNNSLAFSPDEIHSNKLSKISDKTIEILNENLLQAIYQGYTLSGNVGFYISYEGFMPIISSMITQYYKQLKQKSNIPSKNKNNSLNYILTSTCFENTYSHQNPDFVNTLLEKPDDKFYNVFYPKDVNNLIKCIDFMLDTRDTINVVTTSKRHTKSYQNYNDSNIEIETLIECDNPDLILCATGDYMLDKSIDLYNNLKDNYNIKIVYVTKPQILSVNSNSSLDDVILRNYFDDNIPIIYLFMGYASNIKSLIYERGLDCTVLGYNDGISNFGSIDNNFEQNKLSTEYLKSICEEKIDSHKKIKVLRRMKYE